MSLAAIRRLDRQLEGTLKTGKEVVAEIRERLVSTGIISEPALLSIAHSILELQAVCEFPISEELEHAYSGSVNPVDSERAQYIDEKLREWGMGEYADMPPLIYRDRVISGGNELVTLGYWKWAPGAEIVA